MGQMGVRMLHRNLLQAAWLCCLLVVQGHSCPDVCSKCSGPEKDQCEECRAGWILHNNTCVGTVYRTLCMRLDIIIYMSDKQTNHVYLCLF